MPGEADLQAVIKEKVDSMITPNLRNVLIPSTTILSCRKPRSEVEESTKGGVCENIFQEIRIRGTRPIHLHNRPT